MSLDMRYTLQQFNLISFNGFEYSIPQQTIDIINNLATEVGSSAHVKSTLFQKKYVKDEKSSFNKETALSTDPKYTKRRKGNKAMEISNDEWENIRTFQPTKMEHKTGIENDIDQIRLNLNKLTDKTFLEIREKIIDVIDKILQNTDFNQQIGDKISSTIYDILSCNKFYSKMYAELYAELLNKYSWLTPLFQQKMDNYMDNFKNIEYCDPDKDYDKFCEMNKQNELRRAQTLFILNLAINGCISKITPIKYLKMMLELVMQMIHENDKKYEVDELTENIASLYNKEMIEEMEEHDDYELDDFLINGKTIDENIAILAKAKSKDYKSLSNKATFKYMDLIEI
jgi:hypothetical protein